MSECVGACITAIDASTATTGDFTQDPCGDAALDQVVGRRKRDPQGPLDLTDIDDRGAHQVHDQFPGMARRPHGIGSLEQTVFRMNALHVAQANGLRVINPPRALEIAIDKWLTLETVRRDGLLIPRTICCQTRDHAMEAWEMLGRSCVVKPIFGGEGRGIMQVNDADMAWRVFTTLEQLRAVIYCQEFLDGPGYDLRLLVIADAIFCVKRNGNGDWRTNVARGGSAEAFEPTFEQIQIAFKACRAVGAWMAGVDLLTDRRGRDVVLEVNAVPGWKATAKALDVDIARVILEKLLFSNDAFV